MSNLAQQYISQSYQSVINVGTGSGASISSTLQPLTDGYGTISPLSVSSTAVGINGNVYITGSIIPQGSGSFDLGTPTNPFRHAYFSSQSVYLDGHQILSLTPDGTSNLVLQAPTGSSILIGQNISVTNPEITIRPGLILSGSGLENNSSIQFQQGDGYVTNVGNDLIISAVDDGGTPSTASVIIGGIFSNTSNVLVQSPSGSVDLRTDNGVITVGVLGSGTYNVAVASGSSQQNYKNLFINATDVFSLTSPSNLYVSSSANLVLDGNAVVVGTSTLDVVGDYPNIYLEANTNGSGSAFAGVTTYVDATTDPTNVYSAFQLYDPINNNTFGMAISSYNFTGGVPAGTFYGPGTGTRGDDTVFQVVYGDPKLTFYRNTVISGSLNVSGSAGIVGSLQITGSGGNGLSISGSGLYSEGDILTSGSVIATNSISSFNNIIRTENYDGISPKLNIGLGAQNYPGIGVTVNSDINFGNIYGYISIDDIDNANNNTGIALQSFTPYGSGLVTQMYGGGVNSATSDNTIFFAESGNLHFTRDTIDTTGDFNVAGSVNISGTTVLGGPLYANGNQQYATIAVHNSGSLTFTSGSNTPIPYTAQDVNYDFSFNPSVNPSRLWPVHSGVYNIQFSAQFKATSGAGNVWVWLAYGGSAVANTTTRLHLNNNEEAVMALNFVVDYNGEGSYYEIYMRTDNSNIVLLGEPAFDGVPAIPSIITTITQAR